MWTTLRSLNTYFGGPEILTWRALSREMMGLPATELRQICPKFWRSSEAAFARTWASGHLRCGESGDWRDYRGPLAKRRKKDKNQPSRWNGKVLAFTDPTLSAREVVEWYEIRWQSELFFRELKSRMQMRCYVFMKFEAVERYLDLLLMGSKACGVFRLP